MGWTLGHEGHDVVYVDGLPWRCDTCHEPLGERAPEGVTVEPELALEENSAGGGLRITIMGDGKP